MMNAIKKANDRHLDIMDVYSPFPIHGLDKLLGMDESRLHIVGFIFGLLGCLVGFLGMTWIFVSDWPTIFGGKPYWAIPAFIPVTFEMTVLFCGIGMTVVFYIICGLGFGVDNPILDNRITDDKFCIAFQTNDMNEDGVDGLKGFLDETGAEEIHSKRI